MHSFWKQQLPVVLAASLIVASWPLPAAANAPIATVPQLIKVMGAGAAPAPANLPVSGQVIVKFRQQAAGFAGMSTASMGTASMSAASMSAASMSTARAVAGQGGAVLHQDGQSRMVVKLPGAVAAASALIAALRSMPDVAYVENNDAMKAFAAPPDDAHYSELWGLARMNVAAAWQLQSPVAPVVVAVVDTGVDSAHPDLQGRVLPGFNVIDGTTDSMDDNSHGTHVSGTIAALYNNALGITGVAGPADVRILPVKVLDASGSGNFYTVAQGVDWAADHGAQVINLSLGGGHSDIVQEAILRAQSKGVVVVVAAGNENVDTASVSPADVPGVVTVAALDTTDRPADFSNHGDQVDVIAPGVSILSTVPGGGYEAWAGTSMASPHVAGLAALLKAAHPDWTRWAIQACILASVDPVAQSGYGSGVPQADRALGCNPSTLDRKYALKLEGPDPDQRVVASQPFWFDVKAGGGRVTVKDRTGAILGAQSFTGEGLVSLVPDLTRLVPGRNTLTATLSDQAGAVITTQTFTVTVGQNVGLKLSATNWNPAREKLRISTALTGNTHYDLYVLDGDGWIVKTLVSNRTYTGPIFWDGKERTGRWLPDGSYYIYAVTDAGAEALVNFALRVPPTPVAPTLTLAQRFTTVATAQIAGKVNPNFVVEARLKAPGSRDFTSIDWGTVAEPDGTFAAPLALTSGEGTYEIQIRGVDPLDNRNASPWTASARVQFDATVPVIQLTAPRPVAGVIASNQNRLSLTGTAEAGALVTALAENPTAAAATKTVTADGRGLWKMDLPLANGDNRLTLSAVDAAGNAAIEQHFDVTVDAAAPTLSPDSLTLTAGDTAHTSVMSRGTYGFTTALAPRYMLTGRMSEPIGNVVPSNNRLTPTSDGNSFAVELSPALRDGSNTLTFDIYDVAGNKTRLMVAVVLDGTKPSLSVVEKDSAVAAQAAPVTFTVNASEPLRDLQVLSGNDRPLDELTIVRSASTDGRKWTVRVAFPTGDAAWALQFVGVDLAGNVGEPDARARRQVIIDGTSPVLSLANSTDAVIYSSRSPFTVTGTVMDTGAGVKSLTVGSTVVTPDKAGKFSARVSLPEGRLTAIPVVALDGAGNKRTETLQVLMKSRVGGLTVSTPRLSAQKQLTITGKTDAAIVLPDGPAIAAVPVTVVITDSLKVGRTYQAAVDPNGTYSLTADAADWPKGNYTVKVTAGVPDQFVGTAFTIKTATASLTIR